MIILRLYSRKIIYVTMLTNTDINREIASFLPKGDLVSLLQTNRELRNDLYDIPYKYFVFDWWANMRTIELFVRNAHIIEELTIVGYSFVQQLMVVLPNLRRLKISHCDISDDFLKLYLPTLNEINISQCKLDKSIFNGYNVHRIEIDSVVYDIIKN